MYLLEISEELLCRLRMIVLLSGCPKYLFNKVSCQDCCTVCLPPWRHLLPQGYQEWASVCCLSAERRSASLLKWSIFCLFSSLSRPVRLALKLYSASENQKLLLVSVYHLHMPEYSEGGLWSSWNQLKQLESPACGLCWRNAIPLNGKAP